MDLFVIQTKEGYELSRENSIPSGETKKDKLCKYITLKRILTYNLFDLKMKMKLYSRFLIFSTFSFKIVDLGGRCSAVNAINTLVQKQKNTHGMRPEKVV